MTNCEYSWRPSMRIEKTLHSSPMISISKTVIRSWRANDWKDEGRTIYHDTARVISAIWLAKARAFLFSENANHPATRRMLAVSRQNKLRRMNERREMTFKFVRGENDENIHMTRTLHTSRVIGWYSDIGELSFAFILWADGHSPTWVKRPRSPLSRYSLLCRIISGWLVY